MSAVPQSSLASVKPMQVLVKGRVDARRRYEKTVYTRVVTPAADPYSRPQTLEVRSAQPVGSVGDLVSLVCVVGGFSRKPYRITDRETGETQTIVPVDITLDVVE